MAPFVVNGELWRVIRVEPGDPRLIDRTGKRAVATTDAKEHVVNISSAIVPPFLDRVLLHEVAHVITISHGLLDVLRIAVPHRYWVFIEEWAAQLVESHGIEAATVASQVLGRPICVDGWCN